MSDAKHGHPAKWCVHYVAAAISGDDKCAAGVPMGTFRGVKFDHRPCFLDDQGRSKPGALECQHLRRPTAEEIAAHKEWADAGFAKLIAAMKAIGPWRARHKGKSAAEVVECPICGGRLHLAISGYNGHVRGQCESPDCISWME